MPGTNIKIRTNITIKRNQGIMDFVKVSTEIPVFLQITNITIPTGGVTVPIDIRMPTNTPK
jgi:hypothetical protein